MNKELLFDDDIVFFHNQYYKSSVWKKMTKQMPEKGIFPSLRGESVEGVNFDEYRISSGNRCKFTSMFRLHLAGTSCAGVAGCNTKF